MCIEPGFAHGPEHESERHCHTRFLVSEEVIKLFREAALVSTYQVVHELLNLVQRKSYN